MPGGFPLGLDICNGTDIASVLGSSAATVVTGGSQAYNATYTQLINSTAADSCFMAVMLSATSTNASNQQAVNIAVGGIGSEVVIINDLKFGFFGTLPGSITYVFPICIPAGTRVSATAFNSSANATDSIRVQVILFDGAFTQIEGCAGVDSIGNGTTTALDTVLTASGSANTKGSYSQLVASSARDYMWLEPRVGYSSAGGAPTAANYLIDLAIGAGGSEVVIIPNIFASVLATATIQQRLGTYPINIPAGTRIAARAQASVASAQLGFSLYGAYQ